MSATGKIIRHFSISRFNPDKDEKPYMQDYKVTLPKLDMMLLDALMLLKEQDETLSFRRSCGEGVCGSDGMNINGKNGLACITSIASLPKKIVLRPLPGLPVIRDLTVDMKQFTGHLKGVLKNDELPPAKEHLQTPEEREMIDGLWECILCACCSSSCPSYWWNPDKFRGPAALLQEARFVLDSRATDQKERLENLAEDTHEVFRCRSIMNCVKSCPKGLNPTKAIGKIKNKMLDEGI